MISEKNLKLEYYETELEKIMQDKRESEQQM